MWCHVVRKYVRRAERESSATSEPHTYRLKNDGHRSLSKSAQPHRDSELVSTCCMVKIMSLHCLTIKLNVSNYITYKKEDSKIIHTLLRCVEVYFDRWELDLRREVERAGSSETSLLRSQKNMNHLLRNILRRIENKIGAAGKFSLTFTDIISNPLDLGTAIAQSVQRLATRQTVRG